VPVLLLAPQGSSPPLGPMARLYSNLIVSGDAVLASMYKELRCTAALAGKEPTPYRFPLHIKFHSIAKRDQWGLVYI